MTAAKSNTGLTGKTWPISVSLGLIVGAILLSFVDLTFLNDVIGKILDLGTGESVAVACALGLVGIAFMAHHGLNLAHGSVSKKDTATHYILWILLGIAFLSIRLFSATIMGLDNTFDNQTVIKVAGMNIREMDLVIAPLMFFLYLATGLMVKDGVRNLFANPDYKKMLDAWAERRATKKRERDERAAAAAEKNAKLKDRAAKQAWKRKLEALARRAKEQEDADEKRVQDALNGSYSYALGQYREKENEIKEKYQKISANIVYIEDIDEQERDFESKVKPNLLKIIEDTMRSTHNSVALAIRKKTGEDVSNFRTVIDTHNSGNQPKSPLINKGRDQTLINVRHSDNSRLVQ